MSTLAVVVFVLAPAGACAQAAEILERSQQAFYYAGADMKARVAMDLLTDAGKKRTRVFTERALQSPPLRWIK